MSRRCFAVGFAGYARAATLAAHRHDAERRRLEHEADVAAEQYRRRPWDHSAEARHIQAQAALERLRTKKARQGRPPTGPAAAEPQRRVRHDARNVGGGR